MPEQPDWRTRIGRVQSKFRSPWVKGVAALTVAMTLLAAFEWMTGISNIQELTEAFRRATAPRDVERIQSTIAANSQRFLPPGTCDVVCPNFQLRDQDGRLVSVMDGEAAYSIVSLGSTQSKCVSVVETMSILSRAFAPSIRVSAYYLAADPRVDTLESAKAFVDHYDLRAHVLTGTENEMAEAARQLKAHFQRRDDSFDHSTVMYLFDREGKFIAPLEATMEPVLIAKAIIGYIEESAMSAIPRKRRAAVDVLGGLGLATPAYAAEDGRANVDAGAVMAAVAAGTARRRLPDC